MSKRTAQVAQLIQQELMQVFRREIADPRLKEITLTRVVPSPDLKQARVFFTCLEPARLVAMQGALDKATGFLRHHLAAHVDLRYVPKLIFEYDSILERAEAIKSLIDSVCSTDSDEV